VKCDQCAAGYNKTQSGECIPPGEKVLIVTGLPYDNGRRSEIIDLEDSSFTCSKVNQFPVRLYASTGGLVGSTPFVCGGYTGSYSNACYTLQENGAWKQDRTASLNTARGYAASGSVIMSNQLVIAGGLNNYLSSIELVSPNARSATLPRGLPFGLYGSCIVPWDANTFMVIGGISSSGASRRETYFITPSNKTVTNGPKLQNARLYVACHDMIVNGEEFIIVIGGRGGEKTIEVLSKARVVDGWKMGRNLPVKIAVHQVVASPDRKSLYTIGNAYSTTNNKDIFKFSCTGNPGIASNCNWTKIPTELKYGRYQHLAFTIPNALAKKICN